MPVIELIDLGAAAPPRTPLLGLDLGEKTIGVAVSDRERMIASPLELIRKSRFTVEAERLFVLMQDRGAGGIVIGLPVNMDGTEGPRCQSVRAATTPRSLNTFRCWDTAERVTGRPVASSPTDIGRRHRRSKIARRVGSPKASNSRVQGSRFMTVMVSPD